MASSTTKVQKAALVAYLNRLKTGSELGGDVVTRGGIASYHTKAMAEKLANVKGAKEIMQTLDSNLEKAFDEYINAYLKQGDKFIDEQQNAPTEKEKAVFRQAGVAIEDEDKAFRDYAKAKLREDLKSGIGNKGWKLEFKLFLISGNIDTFGGVDNLAGYAGGDLNILQPKGSNIYTQGQIIGAQAKASGGTFTLNAPEALVDQTKKFEAMMTEFATKYGRENIDKATMRQNFIKRTALLADNLRYAKDLQANTVAWSKSNKNTERLKKFFIRYLEVSAAHYYIMGTSANADMVTAVPHERFLDFVTKWAEDFKEVSAENGMIKYAYAGTFGGEKKMIKNLLTIPLSDKNRFHVHHLEGLGPFIAARNKAFGYAPGVPAEEQSSSYKSDLQTHRNFLDSHWDEFNYPHVNFLGGQDYRRGL